MTFTTYGRKRIALLLGSSLPTEYIQYFGVGAGSGTEDVSNVTLIDEKIRFGITGSPNFTEDRKVTFTGDLNSVQASGLDLREFGLFNVSGTGFIGSTWSREQLTSNIECDGTIELRFESSIEVM